MPSARPRPARPRPGCTQTSRSISAASAVSGLAEPSRKPRKLRALSGGPPARHGQHRHDAGLHPAQDQQVGQVLHHVAQRVDHRVRRVGADLQRRGRRGSRPASSASLGNLRHPAAAARLARGEPEAVVEQRGAERDGHGQVVGASPPGRGCRNRRAGSAGRAPGRLPPWVRKAMRSVSVGTAARARPGSSAMTSKARDQHRRRPRRDDRRPGAGRRRRDEVRSNASASGDRRVGDLGVGGRRAERQAGRRARRRRRGKPRRLVAKGRPPAYFEPDGGVERGGGGRDRGEGGRDLGAAGRRRRCRRTKPSVGLLEAVDGGAGPVERGLRVRRGASRRCALATSGRTSTTILRLPSRSAGESGEVGVAVGSRRASPWPGRRRRRRASAALPARSAGSTGSAFSRPCSSATSAASLSATGCRPSVDLSTPTARTRCGGSP